MSSYAATAGNYLAPMTAAPDVLALQRAIVWLVGASVAIVFIEPSPYELATLAASVIFFATGLRMRLVFIPLLLLLFLVNLGYTISAVAVFDRPNVPNWIATSWYMAVTVVFFAMVISEDTAARLDMLRRGLVVGALIAALAGIAGYFNLVPGGRDLLTLYDRARGTFKDPNVFGAFLVLPALFRQKRFGFNNERIDVFKFRSMHHHQADPTASKVVTRNDPRVTRVGRFIRKTSLDELPQLFNVVFKSNLSLVGPRPHAVQGKLQSRLFDEAVDGYFARHRVKPGITGWAQINGWRGEVDTDEKIQKRVEFDLYYIENWSVLFDLYILLGTPLALMTKSENAY